MVIKMKVNIIRFFAICLCAIAWNHILAGSDKLLITGFDADEVEVRKGEKYVLVPGPTLGELPIEVLESDNRNFLRIKGRDGAMLWVNGGDVVTSDLESYRRNCTSLVVTESDDRKQYGLRGVGEKCK